LRLAVGQPGGDDLERVLVIAASFANFIENGITSLAVLEGEDVKVLADGESPPKRQRRRRRSTEPEAA
jgi:hypothetical protein